MAETANIAALALKVSEEIFIAFGWKIVGIMDENFPCEKVDKHQTKSKKGTHPTDCVFTYPDPFENRHVLLLTDLKSYAKSSIKTSDFKLYVRNLAKAIDCAAVSSTWLGRYKPSAEVQVAVEGLLFVYNHDEKYDETFRDSIAGANPGTLPQRPSARVHVLGPDDISYLQSIVADLKQTCAEKEMKYSSRGFFYSQQVLRPPRESLLSYATIEMLRSNIQVAAASDDKGQKHFLVYIRGQETVPELEYLITFLFRSGVVSLATSISIKGIAFSSEVSVNFATAQKNFLDRHYKMKEIEEALKRITWARVARFTNGFSPVDVAAIRK